MAALGGGANYKTAATTYLQPHSEEPSVVAAVAKAKVLNTAKPIISPNGHSKVFLRKTRPSPLHFLKALDRHNDAQRHHVGVPDLELCLMNAFHSAPIHFCSFSYQCCVLNAELLNLGGV